jgi:hypothetical protein
MYLHFKGIITVAAPYPNRAMVISTLGRLARRDLRVPLFGGNVVEVYLSKVHVLGLGLGMPRHTAKKEDEPSSTVLFDIRS